MNYDICLCFEKCHKQLLKHLRLLEQRGFEEDLDISKSSIIYKKLITHFEEQINNCSSILQKTNDKNPEVIGAAKSRVFALSLLHHLEDLTKERFKEGCFSANEVEFIQKVIRLRFKDAESLKFPNLPTQVQILRNVFNVPRKHTNLILNNEVSHYKAGEIITESSDIDAFLVICGKVTETYYTDNGEEIQEFVGAGNVAGMMNLLIDAREASCRIKADGEVSLVRFQRDSVMQQEDILQKVLKAVALKCILRRKNQLPDIRDTPIKSILQNSSIGIIDSEDKFLYKARIILSSQTMMYPLCIFASHYDPNLSDFPKICVILPNDFKLRPQNRSPQFLSDINIQIKSPNIPLSALK